MATEKTDFEKPDLVDSDQASGGLDTPWTVEEETAVRRKIDFAILPVVTVLYLLCFLDRANIGNARIQGLGADLNLVQVEFNWCLTIFFITYGLVEVPSNILLKRIGARWWIPFLVLGFGLISLCTAFVQNFAQLMALRALLGVFEGGTMPGIAFYLSCFYRRRELLFRIGIFVSSASMAGAFGGLLAAGLTRIPTWGAPGAEISTWRNIFFFEGLITMIAGAIAPFLMPQNPETARFLTERQRYIAAQRLFLEHKANPNEKVKWHHVKRAVFNVNNNICAFGFFFCNITVQGLSLFMPTLLRDLGWTATRAQLMTVPPYVSASMLAILVAFLSDRTGKRGMWLAFLAPFCVTGFAVLRNDVATNIKYMAVFFVTVGAFPAGPGFLSWGINNAAGPAVRAVTGGYIVSVGTLGAIVATWSYLPTDGPDYPIGHSINLSAQSAVFAMALGGIAYVLYENKKRDAGKRDNRLVGLSEAEVDDLGYRHPEFRYIP